MMRTPKTKVLYSPADLITLVRILCALALFFFEPLSVRFLLVYLLGGFSDVLDGLIARRSHQISDIGASLDSLADLCFIAASLAIILPFLAWPGWVIGWVLIIAAIRLLSLAVGFMKHHTLAFIHTIANKFTGLLLFCFPFLNLVLGLSLTALVLCIVATLSALEECLINITSKSLNRNRPSFFTRT